MPLEPAYIMTCDRCQKKGYTPAAQLITTFSPYSAPHKKAAIKKARAHGWICKTRDSKGIKGQSFICPKCREELLGEYEKEA